MKQLKTLSLLTLASLSLPLSVLAQDTITITPPTQYNSLVGLTPSRYVTTAIALLLGFSGVFAFIYLLWGGLQWITAGGDKDAVEKARKKIIQALIGLSVVFSAYAIIYIIRVLFQVNLISVTITNL
jgi:hypothetical protein